MTNMPRFRPGLSASQAHSALKTTVEIADRAQHCAVLWFAEIRQRRLYRELGYSTMRAYALNELGFSPTRTGDFITLSRKLESLPRVKHEMAAGRLGYTVAREIAAVAAPETEEEWLTEAQNKSRRELSATVKHARDVARNERAKNPDQHELLPRPTTTQPVAAVPIRVSFELTPLEYARYEALLAKAGPHAGKADLLLAMATALAAEKTTPRGVNSADPHYQIHVHQCPDCAKHTVQTPQGEKELTVAETAAVNEDTQVREPGRNNTTAIPPGTRRKVLARDRHQCRRLGCTHTRHLHIHHLRPRGRGGTNDQDNLVTLCSACHRLLHERGDEIQPLLTDPPHPSG